jgi:uncharacterized membrane protein HdeD (DUF308 family)
MTFNITGLTLDTALGIAGIVVSVVFGLIGIAVGIFGVRDGRRERSQRERAVNAVHEIMGRTEGLLIGIKPSLSSNQMAIKAIDDGIDAVKLSKMHLPDL